MKFQSPNLAGYLESTPTIDWKTSAIVEQTQAITQSIALDVDKARILYEWVRDQISHSGDIVTDIVTCSASETLRQRTGLCYSKSHLLAAMLRCSGLPAGFCYQILRCGDSLNNRLVLHGLNAVYLPSLDRWIRLDPRGNTRTINAQFSLDAEILAFSTNPDQGEFLDDMIYLEPTPHVVTTLQSFTSLRELWPCLPGPSV